MIVNLTAPLLVAVLETIPVEFSVVDENDKVLAWNRHGTRIFKRPEAVVGRDVRDCHPKNSLGKVETILQEMKEGQVLDRFGDRWKAGEGAHPVLRAER